jgi:transposase-like protein
MLDLTDPIYSNEAAARDHLAEIRWAGGVYCPHCGDLGNIKKLGGKAADKGLWHCGSCRKKFTVTVGTVFERSHIPLTKWLAAFHLMCASKKGISAHQIHRMLGITYKSAWFMCHRIREAMKRGGLVSPIGGNGKHVEVDETFIGHKDGAMSVQGGTSAKRVVLSLVERGGEVRSFHIDTATISNINPIVNRHLDRASTLNTDEAGRYVGIGRSFQAHQVVNHSQKEYVRGTAYTNTLEGYFSIFKKGMKGVYQHCGEQHLHRYLAEFDFRYNARIALGVDDDTRTRTALKGVTGKRLTYQQAH